MSDKPHEMAVRSPWTPGAWIMELGRLPRGWEHRSFTDDDFTPEQTSPPEAWSHGMIVEARPSGGESS